MDRLMYWARWHSRQVATNYATSSEDHVVVNVPRLLLLLKSGSQKHGRKQRCSDCGLRR